MATTNPVISIVVASHRQQYITELVASFDDNVLGTVPCEIIVVADYPVDRVSSDLPGARWIYMASRSIPAKRNAGIRAARSKLVAFIDDDCIPAKGWIQQCASYLEQHPEAAGVEGQTLLDEPQTMDRNMREFRRLEHGRFRANNVCYRKAYLETVGMFDERFCLQREDIDLAFTLIESGHTIGYNKDMRVYHRVRQNERWDLLKNCKNRRFDPLLYKKHPVLYRQHVGTPFPPTLVLMLGWLAGCMGAALLRRRLLAPLAASGIVGAGALAARRGGVASLASIQGLRDMLSIIVAPCVLLAALLHGSVRYRKLLLL